jgi:transcriptional regulator with XRE-family HTH domain
MYAAVAGATSAKVPRLLFWRTSRALTQLELGTLAGVDPATVHRGERGYPLRLQVIRKLAEALNVEPGQLLYTPPE